MELNELMRFARAYNKLGWAIHQQVDDIVQGNYDDLNPNALADINQHLRGFNNDLDMQIDEALEANRECPESLA